MLLLDGRPTKKPLHRMAEGLPFYS